MISMKGELTGPGVHIMDQVCIPWTRCAYNGKCIVLIRALVLYLLVNSSIKINFLNLKLIHGNESVCLYQNMPIFV